MYNFMEKCLHGLARPSEIDAYVEQWHALATDVPLSVFLGLTEGEYMNWVKDPDSLETVLSSRRENSQHEPYYIRDSRFQQHKG